MLEQFVQVPGHKIASYNRDNVSSTKCNRPEPGCLLMDSHRNDILLAEQTEQHRLRIVSLHTPLHGRRCLIKTLHRLIRSSAKKCGIAARWRNWVSGKRQMPRATVSLRYVAFGLSRHRQAFNMGNHFLWLLILTYYLGMITNKRPPLIIFRPYWKDIPAVRKINQVHRVWLLTQSCYGTLFICRQLWIIFGARTKTNRSSLLPVTWRRWG